MRTSNAKQLRSATTGMERGKFICQGLLFKASAASCFLRKASDIFLLFLGVFLSPLYISLLVSGSRAVMKKQNSESPFLDGGRARQGLYVGTGRDEMAA